MSFEPLEVLPDPLRNGTSELNLPFTPERLAGVLAQAAKIAHDAFNSDGYWAEKKQDGSFVTNVDMAVHEYLTEALPSLYQALVVSEEAVPSYDKRRDQSAIWLIDPIDHTAGLIEGKLDNSSINAALIINGTPALGMVHYLGRDEGFLAIQGEGTFRVANQRLRPLAVRPAQSPARFAAYKSSVSDMQAETQQLYSALQIADKQLVHHNRLPLRLRSVMTGNADVYIDPRPICEWDVVYAFAFIEAIGGQCLSLETAEPIQFNSESLRVPPFILARPGINAHDLIRRIHSES